MPISAIFVNFAFMKKFFTLVLVVAMAVAQGAAGHIVVDGVLDHSTIYPGTVHTFKVSVPEQYKGDEPACLYVGLDGILCNAPAVIDSLITSEKIPVTIGVYLQPGVIKDSRGNVLRYNRSNEFDMPDGRFASFLETELLPLVESLTTPDGRHVRLSQEAGDRMIFGLSSGGICAFNAAWHRPDLFSRVFSGVGTFVAMRGGNDLQAVVRKHEPQPLRVFLQDGTNDVWNALFGHWYEGNRMLASALDFAGYDAAYDWSDCNHGVRRASEIFADVMTWMWRDYPAPIKVGKTSNDLLASLLPDTTTQWVVTNGPRRVRQHPNTISLGATYPDSTFRVTPEQGTNCLTQTIIREDGTEGHSQRFYWLHSYDNSLLKIGPMLFDSLGNLYVVTNAGIQICDQNGRVRGILKLPVPIEEAAELIIAQGEIAIRCPNGQIHTRRLNIAPATPGFTPAPQGQG